MRRVGTLGDKDFITYDGGLILCDDSGDYRIEYVQAPTDDVEDDDPDARWVVFRADVRDPGSWVHWPDVARTRGQEPADYLALWAIETGQDEIFRDEHAVNCARAIEDAATYYGWVNFDSYPLVLTRAEIEARYPDKPETPPAAHGTDESGGVFPHD